MAKKGSARKAHHPRGTVDAAVKWMADNGTTLRMAASHFDVTHQAISHAWRRLMAGELMPSRTEAAAKRAEIVALVEAGCTIPAICRRLSISDYFVRLTCRELRLKPACPKVQARARLREAIAKMRTGATAIDVAVEYGLSDGYLREKRRPSKARSYVARRDGRSVRAAILVEAGLTVRAAAEAELTSTSSVRTTLKRRRIRRSLNG